ncbi:MAG: hypothetical protein HC884_01860 [Chloroflexaceae bacterium]|nr:hypothetical protein [Chloroflexaceae bacterium]
MSDEPTDVLVMVAAFDAHDTVVFWNEACERMTGYCASDIVGNPGSLDLLGSESAYRGVAKLTGWRNPVPNGPALLPIHFQVHCWDLTITTRDGTPRALVWVETGPASYRAGPGGYLDSGPGSEWFWWLVTRHLSLITCPPGPVVGGVSWGMGMEVPGYQGPC